MGGEDLDDLLEQVDLLLDVKRYDQALTLLARAAGRGPDSARVHARRAMAFYFANRPEEAAAAAARAISLEPGWEWPHRLRGAALTEQALAARGPRARELAQLAVEAAQESLRIDPTNSLAYVTAAEAQLAAGDAAAAEISAQRATALAPHEPGTWVTLSLVFIHRKDWARAEAASRRALAIDPVSAHALNNLGAALDGMGRPKEGARAFADAARLSPDEPTAGENVVRSGLDRIRVVLLFLISPVLLAGYVGLVVFYAVAVGTRKYTERPPERIPPFLRTLGRRWGLRLGRKKHIEAGRLLVVLLVLWAVVTTVLWEVDDTLGEAASASVFLILLLVVPRVVRETRWTRRRSAAGK